MGDQSVSEPIPMAQLRAYQFAVQELSSSSNCLAPNCDGAYRAAQNTSRHSTLMIPHDYTDLWDPVHQDVTFGDVLTALAPDPSSKQACIRSVDACSLTTIVAQFCGKSARQVWKARSQAG